MRLIDAEYCEDFFDRWESRVKNADPVTIDVVQNTRTLLRDAPSIDLIRCAECRKVREDGGHANCGGYLYCRKWKTLVDEDGYCSMGEREGE